MSSYASSVFDPNDFNDACPDDIVPKLTWELVDAITFHLFSCGKGYGYSRVRDVAESFISLINKEANGSNKARIVQKKVGQEEDALLATDEIMDVDTTDWYDGIARASRKRRLSGSYGGSHKEKRRDAHIQLSKADIAAAIHMPGWPSYDSPSLAVEILDRLYFGFCLQSGIADLTVQHLEKIAPTHIVMICNPENTSVISKLYTNVKSLCISQTEPNFCEKLEDALQFIHSARFEDTNTVVAICCDSTYYSCSGLLVAAYIQAFLGHQLYFAIRAIKGYHLEFVVRPEDIKFCKQFLSPERLSHRSFGDVGCIDDVKELDNCMCCEGVNRSLKWSSTRHKDHILQPDPWTAMMEELCNFYSRYWTVTPPEFPGPYNPSEHAFIIPSFEHVTLLAREKRYHDYLESLGFSIPTTSRVDTIQLCDQTNTLHS